MRKPFFALAIFLVCVSAVSAADGLIIHPEDIRLVPDGTVSETAAGGDKVGSVNGYHLYIRKLPGIESVMLVETTKDPAGENDNYAYRALSYNPVNGDETRYLNKKPLASDYAKYSLIDSTPEKDDQFGEAFHIYIPSEITYGYPWSRNGVVKIGKGTFINIRSFSKKYADYTGEYADNAYMFDLAKVAPKPVVKAPEPPAAPEPVKEVTVLTDDYNPVAAESFKVIAGFGGGEMVYSKGPETLTNDIMDSVNRIDPKTIVDVVFAIDTTGSMKDDVDQLRKEWVPRLLSALKEFQDLRIGLLLYRDYGDSYNYKGLPVKLFDFTTSTGEFTKNLNGFKIYGTEGGDIPEAVYEALYSSMEFYPWRKDAQRKVILIGDAEPHPTPRMSGKYSKELVAKMAQDRGIKIDTIIVPDDKSKRGR